jgi:hypothetical protein
LRAKSPFNMESSISNILVYLNVPLVFGTYMNMFN